MNSVTGLILEGIVTTLTDDDQLNVSPMGPRVTPKMDRFELRPFHTSQTYRNLKRHGEGVFHVIDDALLLAKAALGPVEPPPAVFPAAIVHGFVLQDACRYYEFRMVEIDERDERVRIDAEVVRTGRLRDFFGWNRAKHAVVEAAILATRTAFIPLDDIARQFEKLQSMVDKTGGSQEQEAFAFLKTHIETVQRQQAIQQ